MAYLIFRNRRWQQKVVVVILDGFFSRFLFRKIIILKNTSRRIGYTSQCIEWRNYPGCKI